MENWLKTYYMRDKVGEVFEGKISGMTSFGIFVTLDGIHIDGLVHISDLGEDYFNFRPEIMAIEGERSGIRFNMGDRVAVRVARADLDDGKIDFVLIAGGAAGGGKLNHPRLPNRQGRRGKGSRKPPPRKKQPEAAK